MRERVEQGLSPLTERRADDVEHERFVLRDNGLGVVETYLHHGGIDLGARHKIACRHGEQSGRFSVVGQDGCYGTVGIVARCGAEAVGDLLLHHHGDTADGQARLQKAHKNGCSDIIRQIRANQNRLIVKIFLPYFGKIGFHGVAGEQGEIIFARHGLLQYGNQAAVDL